jgi:PAS domain S-box-containing protein
MSTARRGTVGHMLGLSADLGRVDSPEAAVGLAVQMAETAFDSAIAVVWACDGARPDPLDASAAAADQFDAEPWSPPAALVDGIEDTRTEMGDLRGEVQTERYVPAGAGHVLSLGSTRPDAFDDEDESVIDSIGATLGETLDRLDRHPRTGPRRGGETQRDEDTTAADAAALRRLQASTDDDSERTIEELLSLGGEYLGLETGVFARVEGGEYSVETAVDTTGTREQGAVLTLGETLCDVTLAGDEHEVLALARTGDTEYATHPGADGVGAYVGAPVVVSGAVYGTVSFTSPAAREPFRAAERAFVRVLARQVGAEIEHRQQLGRLERYETVVEAVGDPIYALDGRGRFTFVNEAAREEFGYDESVLGEHVSVGMKTADIDRVRGQIERLLETDRRSATAQFELETADGRTRTVENHLATIDDGSGTVGVLRDVTERERRRRRLDSFREAVEAAADGVAVLEDDEYVYVDGTHVDLYGFDSKADLLGGTWRQLYDDDEIARLESEAFPVLAADGHWRGQVTGSRPDGTTFPAELSLTAVGDNRLVCTVRDETRRAARERDLAVKERAMDEAGVGIGITDPTQEGNPIVYVNSGFERITGHDRAEAVGRDPWSLQCPDPEKRATLRAVAETEQPVSVEVRDTRPDGESYWVALSVTPVFDDRGTLTNLVCVQQDITEQKQREQEREATVAVLERVYRVTTDPSLSFDEKVDGLLSAGREYLDLPNGFLTRIDPDEGPDGRQTVVGARGSHDLLQEGEACPLPQSYCRKTVGSNEVMTLTNAAEMGWEGDPAHDTFGLETYIGGEIAAGGELYGTLCFASTEPRERQFSGTEQSFVSLVRRWVGYEVERERRRTELCEQRERLELVLSGTGTGIVEWDPQTDTVTWDDTLVEMVGQDPSTTGEFVECVHPDDRDRVQERMAGMLETGDSWTGTFRLHTGTGDTVWLKTRATPVHEDGELVRVVATGTDVTEENRRERERRRNGRRFQSLFEDPEMLVGLLDTDGTLLEVNETALSYVDSSRADVLGEPFPETAWWAHSGRLQSDTENWVRRAADGEYVAFDATHPGPDGTHHVTGTIRPVTDQSGSVESLVVSARDITERRRQQEELEDRQRKLDLVLSNTDTSIAEIDLRSGEMLWDDRLGDNDIGSPETLDSFFETVHPDDRDRVRADIERIRDTGDTLDGEYRIRNESGEYRWIASQTVTVTDDGEPGRLVAIATDVTDLKQREQRLAASRERFRLLVENVDEYAFLTLDGDGRIDTWNSGATALFGHSRETAVGMPVDQFHPDGTSGGADRLLEQARVAGESAHEGWRVRADGSQFYADVRYTPLGSDGEFRGYAMVVRDMTERRRQRRRTELFVEQSDDVVVVLDPDGTITYASGSADRVLGHDAETLVDENLFDYVHSSDRKRAMGAFYDTVDGDTDTTQCEYRFASGDGGWRNVETVSRDVQDTDAVDGTLLYLRDVTERTERVRRLDAVFNGTFQFTGLLEPDGTVVEVNEAALEFGGFDRESVVGRRFDEVRWWTHSEAVRSDLQSALETAASGEFVRYETEVRGADGLRTIDFSAKPITDEDDSVSLLVVEGRDITAQRQSRQHMAVIHRVLRHNMRNDLNKVQAWAQLLADEDDPETRAEHFARIEGILSTWEKMADTLQQIRQAIDTRRTLESDIEAATLIDTVVTEARDRHPATTIAVTAPESASAPVPSRVEAAVRELIDNAVQTDESGAHVRVSLSRPDDGWVEIAVADDGPGMPEMETTVLETGEETQLTHGGGLGLWMVRMLVTGSGGDIGVDASADGTHIRLRLPTD